MPKPKPTTPAPRSETTPHKSRRLSMHENVELWCDCCTCEPEPRWQTVEEELQREERQKAEVRSEK